MFPREFPQGTDNSICNAARNQLSSGFASWDAGFPWSHGEEVVVLLVLGWYTVFLVTCSGASCQVLLGQLISSRDVQGGSCLVAMMGVFSLVLARGYSLLVVRVQSVVAGVSSLSSGGVQAPLSLWCEVWLY